MSENDTVALYWPRDSVFRDTYGNAEYRGEGVYDVPSEHEAQYRRRGWQDPPEDYDGEPEQPGTAENPRHEGPTRDEIEGADPEEAAADDGGDEAEEGSDSGN